MFLDAKQSGNAISPEPKGERSANPSMRTHTNCEPTPEKAAEESILSGSAERSADARSLTTA